MFRNKDQSSRYVHILGLIAWSMFFVLIIKNPSFAANPQAKQNIIENYGTTQILRSGILVQISPTNPENVIPATQQNITKTFGIVIKATDPLVSMSKGNNFHIWTFFGIFTTESMNINGGINEHFYHNNYSSYSNRYLSRFNL